MDERVGLLVDRLGPDDVLLLGQDGRGGPATPRVRCDLAADTCTNVTAALARAEWSGVDWPGR